MKKRKIPIKKYLFWIVSAVIVASLVFLPFSLEKSSENSSGKASILSGTAGMGSISRTLSGAGSLTSEDTIEITVPQGVEITGYLVSDGLMVHEGEPVAGVNKVTVLKSALELSETIKKIEDEMHHAEDDLVSGYIYSMGAGTVKTIYASVGDDVRQVMLDHGCLAVIELENGDEMKVTGISGTVTSVNATEGRSIYNGATMFTLRGLDSTGEYANLAVKHEKYQDLMAQLYQMYSDGYVTAPSSGMIGDVDKTLVKTASCGRPVYATLLAGTALRDDSPARIYSSSTYVCGTVTSVTSLSQVTVSLDGNASVDTDLTAFSDKNPKAGDQVFFQQDIYVDQSGTELPPLPSDYTPLLVNPGTPKGPGDDRKPGQTFPTGNIPASGGMGAGTQAVEEDTLFPVDGTKVATVTPTGKMTVSITVDELDILSIHRGDSARVTIDALPGRSFKGVVTDVNTGSNTENTSSGGNSKYCAEITLDRTGDMLEGMNASAVITVQTTDNILTVPADALCETGTKTYIYTALDKNGEPSNPVEVETGISDGINVQILSGLSEGNSFWYTYYDTLEIDGNVPLFSGTGRRGGRR